MKFHHVCLMVTDIERSIKLWTELLGFKLDVQCVIPDGEGPGPGVFMYPELQDEIFKVKGSRSKMALLTSSGGAMIELQEPEVPKVRATPPENLQYGHTGIHEVALAVEDIDSYFKKVHEMGYTTQTKAVWDCAGIGRSFLFYDDDGNMIQLWEQAGGASWIDESNDNSQKVAAESA